MNNDNINLTTIAGLPFELYLKPGLHKLNFFFAGCMYCPGYVNVSEDPKHNGDTIISHVGLQPHLMQPVGDLLNPGF